MSTQSANCCSDSTTCGCCEGVEVVTPELVRNRPGLPSLAYRVGTHATFLESMQAALSSQRFGAEEPAAIAGSQPLAGLMTRDASDPSMALLDAWAIVADVLTFYQERIANEGYLRTATERRSVLELARLVGYRLRFGVAASTYLAYTIDENVKEPVIIGKGARVQSVPGPGELPQSFETSEELQARALWSQLKPRQTEPQTWEMIEHERVLYLKGISTNLKPNDPILIDAGGDGHPQLWRIVAVTPDAAADRTRIDLRPWKPSKTIAEDPAFFRNTMDRLLQQAPQGEVANRFAAQLKELRALDPAGASPEAVTRFIETKTLSALEASRARVRPSDTRLGPWVDEVGTALEQVLAWARTPLEGSAGEPPVTTFANRLDKLITRPSQPKANALQLRRDLKSSFRPASDAGLQVIGAARPDIQGALTAAVAGYADPQNQPTVKVYALRLKAGLFGQGFPKQTRTVRKRGDAHGDVVESTETVTIGEWPIELGTVGDTLESPLSLVYLDGSYEAIAPGSWIVLDFGAALPALAEPHSVQPLVDGDTDLAVRSVKTVHAKLSRSDYGATGNTTRIDLNGPWAKFEQQPGDQPVIDRDFQIVRKTAVYAQSELLDLAERPITSDVCIRDETRDLLELDALYAALEPGRFVIVTGERVDIPDTSGVLASEPAMIAEVVHDVRTRSGATIPLSQDVADGASALPGDRVHTFIRLDKKLSYCYRRSSASIYANVVKATHGESREESLGSGDATKPMQTFALKQKPLTYIAAATPTGAESELHVFVNDVQWHETDSFVEQEPTDHRYITRTDDAAQTTVTFGNGQQGARLPTGIENVKAAYRNGIGKPGNVRAGQLTMLVTRPLGVKDVINPLRASGGADAESRDQARQNVPVGVRALDRLVSVRDYQDFARAFAGIGKAAASRLSDGHRLVVHVTIAGADDIPIDTGSDLFVNLREALVDFGDAFQPIALATRELRLLVISAGVRILPDYRWETVITAVRSALLDAFGFERRELGESVQASEVLSVMQGVSGVDYVDLDAFGAVATTVADASAEEGRRPSTPSEIAAAIATIVSAAAAGGVSDSVPASLAATDASGIRPAELVLLSPDVPATLVLNQIV